jgi:hypothetical protein
LFIKNNIFGNIHFAIRSHALITFVLGRRTKINTLGASKLKFVTVVGPEMRKTGTTKHFESFIVRMLFV